MIVQQHKSYRLAWAVCVVAHCFGSGGMSSPEQSQISLSVFVMNGMNSISFIMLDQMFFWCDFFIFLPLALCSNTLKDKWYRMKKMSFIPCLNNVCMNKWAHFSSSQSRGILIKSSGVRWFIIFAAGQYMVHDAKDKWKNSLTFLEIKSFAV